MAAGTIPPTARQKTGRAAWLCEAAGTPVEAETNTRMPPDFLLAQIERREALESAKTLDAVEALLAQAGDEARRLEAEIAAAADDEKNWPKAADAARRLMFLQRFIGEAKKARGAFL